jgi:hypothetical protein
VDRMEPCLYRVEALDRRGALTPPNCRATSGRRDLFTRRQGLVAAGDHRLILVE